MPGRFLCAAAQSEYQVQGLFDWFCREGHTRSHPGHVVAKCLFYRNRRPKMISPLRQERHVGSVAHE
jgi:hypothetical protein